MRTHRITVDLPDSAYKTLRETMEAQNFTSEGECIENPLKQQKLSGFDSEEEFARWVREEVEPVYDDAEAHPESHPSLPHA